MIQEVWDAGQSKFRLKTEGLERIRYRPYGFAERQLLADINGDGSVNLDDLNFVMTNFGAAIGSSGYAAQIDTDSSGSINLDDHNAVLTAFGTSVPTDGSLWKNAPGMVGYGGGLYDEVAGLYLFRNRYYDPSEGRWITRDPAGYVDGLNLYQYVQGNPLMYFDPFGLHTYAIDGTHGDWEDNQNIRKILEVLDDRCYYYAGPDDGPKGKDIYEIVDKVYEQILSDYKESLYWKDPIDINLLGYSRGGVAALEVARLLEEQGIEVNFVGLLAGR